MDVLGKEDPGIPCALDAICPWVSLIFLETSVSEGNISSKMGCRRGISPQTFRSSTVDERSYFKGRRVNQFRNRHTLAV